MRFHFLHGGLLDPLDAADPSCRSRPGYLIQTDMGESTQVGIALSGRCGSHIHPALERDGMPNVVRALKFGPEEIASGPLGF